MARLFRVCLPNVPLHVIQRGNNRQVCFGSDEDLAAYAHWLEEYSRKWAVAIHAWVFMTNHVHLLLTQSTGSGVPDLMQAPVARSQGGSGWWLVFHLTPDSRAFASLWQSVDTRMIRRSKKS
jgi:REP element-mobilizing transposase RayT